MCNSCTSVFPNTRAWEQQRTNEQQHSHVPMYWDSLSDSSSAGRSSCCWHSGGSSRRRVLATHSPKLLADSRGGPCWEAVVRISGEQTQ